MGVGRRIGNTLRLPGRGMRRIVTVLVVLMVAGASGSAVALTAPALVGLGPRAATAQAAPPPVPRPVLGPLTPNAPQPTAAGLVAVLDADADAMPGRFTGVVLDAAGGAPLWSRSPDRALVPGSTGKLLTASAALLTLDPTESIVTDVVAGPEPGTVVLVGGGDPTLTALPAGKDGVYPDAPRLADLAEQVRQNSTAPVTKVLVDSTRWRGPELAPGWDPDDVRAGFAAPMTALMVDGGRIDPTLQDGPRLDDPTTAAGRAFAELLGADPDAVGVGIADPDATTLGVVASAPIAELVEHLMRSSDNVLAESLARRVAIAREGEPTFAGAAEQTLAALSQAGFDPTGAVLVDGSGLSTQDRVPATLLGALLTAAAAPVPDPDDTEFLRPIITGLPVAGGDGTLDERFAPDARSASGRGVVRAKTGTLTGVSSLAGIVTDADGRLLVFALMSNGAAPSKIRPQLDAMAADLSRCGCR